MDLHVLPIPIPPPASLPIRSLWVFPVHQPRAPVARIQPGLVVYMDLSIVLQHSCPNERERSAHTWTQMFTLISLKII